MHARPASRCTPSTRSSPQSAPGRRCADTDLPTKPIRRSPSQGVAMSHHAAPPETRTVTPSPTRAVADAEERVPRKSWALLAVALAAQVLVVLDISVVNTALPTIGRSLHLSGANLQWLVTAYLMMSGGGLLLGGRIADLASRRGVFLTGLTLFTAASLVSGFAGSGSELFAARAVQGLSAAL